MLYSIHAGAQQVRISRMSERQKFPRHTRLSCQQSIFAGTRWTFDLAMSMQRRAPRSPHSGNVARGSLWVRQLALRCVRNQPHNVNHMKLRLKLMFQIMAARRQPKAAGACLAGAEHSANDPLPPGMPHRSTATVRVRLGKNVTARSIKPCRVFVAAFGPRLYCAIRLVPDAAPTGRLCAVERRVFRHRPTWSGQDIRQCAAGKDEFLLYHAQHPVVLRDHFFCRFNAACACYSNPPTACVFFPPRRSAIQG